MPLQLEPLHRDHQIRLSPFPEDLSSLSTDDYYRLSLGLRRSPNGAKEIKVPLDRYLKDLDPFNLNSHQDREHVLVLFGCGNIFDRLMKTGFLVLGDRHPWLREKLKIVLVDKDLPENTLREKVSHLKDACGFQHVEPMRPHEFDRAIQEGRLSPNAIYESLPHTLHLASTTHLLDRTRKSGTIIAVEKPLFIPDHVSSYHSLPPDDQSRIIDTDFFTTDILYWLISDPQGQQILQEMKPFHTINFHCIERNKEWREWMHQRHISGGGTMLDCSPHNFHQIAALLEATNRIHGSQIPNLSVNHLDRSAVASYFGRPAFDQLTETAAAVRLKIEEHDLRVQGQAVKWGPSDFYGFEIFSANGNYLGLSLGTQNTSPHIRFSPTDESSSPLHIIFESAPPLGFEYAFLFGRLLGYAANHDAPIVPSRDTGINAALLGVQCAGIVEQREAGKKSYYRPGSRPPVAWIPIEESLIPY